MKRALYHKHIAQTQPLAICHRSTPIGPRTSKGVQPTPEVSEFKCLANMRLNAFWQCTMCWKHWDLIHRNALRLKLALPNLQEERWALKIEFHTSTRSRCGPKQYHYVSLIATMAEPPWDDLRSRTTIATTSPINFINMYQHHHHH